MVIPSGSYWVKRKVRKSSSINTSSGLRAIGIPMWCEKPSSPNNSVNARYGFSSVNFISIGFIKGFVNFIS